jgi:hypothetical protein
LVQLEWFPKLRFWHGFGWGLLSAVAFDVNFGGIHLVSNNFGGLSRH